MLLLDISELLDSHRKSCILTGRVTEESNALAIYVQSYGNNLCLSNRDLNNASALRRERRSRYDGSSGRGRCSDRGLRKIRDCSCTYSARASRGVPRST